MNGEKSVALTQFPGEMTRWILPRIKARTNHCKGVLKGSDNASSVLAQADSAKRESHQVVGNALGIFTLILNKTTIGDVIATHADCAPLALLPQFPTLPILLLQHLK